MPGSSPSSGYSGVISGFALDLDEFLHLVFHYPNGNSGVTSISLFEGEQTDNKAK